MWRGPTLVVKLKQAVTSKDTVVVSLMLVNVPLLSTKLVRWADGAAAVLDEVKPIGAINAYV